MRRGVLLILICLFTDSAWGAADSSEKRKLLAKRPHIEKIIISGNHSFSEGKIRKKLYSREDGIWQTLGLMRGNRFTKSNLNYDKLLLEYYYKSRDFPMPKSTLISPARPTTRKRPCMSISTKGFVIASIRCGSAA